MHVSAALGEAGAPVPVVVAGKTYKMSHLTKKRQAEIESWLSERAQEGCVKLKKILSEDQYVSLLAKHNDAWASGQYDFGGEYYRKAVQTWDGSAMLVYVLLKPHHPELTPEKVGSLLEDHSPEFRAGVERVIAEYQGRMGVDAQGKPLPPKETEAGA